MHLSVVIPAYNEEGYLAATLEALETALTSIDDAEIIVVDHESTDATREIEEGLGATIVTETEHNISKVRNTGGVAATGDVLVFLDADTLVRPGLFEKIIEEMSDARCVGGSVKVEYERADKAWVRLFIKSWAFWARFTR